MSECQNKLCRRDAMFRVELRGEEGSDVVTVCDSCHRWANDSRKLEVRNVGR